MHGETPAMGKTHFRYFETGSTDPYYNLAFEEYLFDHFLQDSILMLWQNDRTVVIGRNQITQQQVNIPFIEAHRINVVRRMTGGGAVYHDLGNLNYSFITDEVGSSVSQSLEILAVPIVEALRGLGLEASVSGRNDILVSGRKVSGTAQRAAHGRILHHGTLLFDSDEEMISGALRVDEEKFRGKGVRSVKSRIRNILLFLDEAALQLSPEKRSSLPADISKFWEYLRKALNTNSDGAGTVSAEMLSSGVLSRESLSPEELPPEMLKEISRLAETKYRSYEWNFGRSPRFEFSSRRYLPGGLLECFVDVKDGRISGIRFCGDFLARRPLDEIEEKLNSVPFEWHAVRDVLNETDLRPYFGDIENEAILDTLFDAVR